MRNVEDEVARAADRHRFELAPDDALRLALRFLRTHAPADRGERVGAAKDVRGTRHVARRDGVDGRN